MSQLYLECTSGISGDMLVGALLDLGADRVKLEQVLATVPADGFTVSITTVRKSGIEACDFGVILDGAHENHDHDMAYLYGPGPGYDADRPGFGPEQERPGCPWGPPPDMWMWSRPWGAPPPHRPWDCPPPPHSSEGPDDRQQDDLYGHSHEHGHSHGHHHEHRNLQDVYAVIDGTQMSDSARELSKEIFRIVAEAESEVHGLPIEQVHFHEVGALDSIVDIIAIAVCYDDLREKESINGVIIPVLYEGGGTVRCQHGVLPVPVPAVTAIVREKGLHLHLMPDRGEFVTPTGAAAAAALQTSERLPEKFLILKTGLGAGKREYPGHSGLLRAMLIAEPSLHQT